MLEKTPESPLDCKDIKPVNIKGNQLWIFLGRTYAEAETPVFWSSDVNSWLIGKVPDARKDWGQKEKRASKDEMAAWHHRRNGHGLGQTLGDGEGQRGLASAVHGAAKRWTWLGDWTIGQKYSSYPLTILTMSHIIYSFLGVSSFLPSVLFLPTLIITTQSLTPAVWAQC